MLVTEKAHATCCEYPGKLAPRGVEHTSKRVCDVPVWAHRPSNKKRSRLGGAWLSTLSGQQGPIRGHAPYVPHVSKARQEKAVGVALSSFPLSTSTRPARRKGLLSRFYSGHAIPTRVLALNPNSQPSCVAPPGCQRLRRPKWQMKTHTAAILDEATAKGLAPTRRMETGPPLQVTGTRSVGAPFPWPSQRSPREVRPPKSLRPGRRRCVTG